MTQAAEVVRRLVSEQGEDAYHGVRWRDEVIAAMTQRPPDADPEAGYDTREVVWPGVGPPTEVLMDEGDLIFFEPMSMHSASRCVNGVARYCWVSDAPPLRCTKTTNDRGWADAQRPVIAGHLLL